MKRVIVEGKGDPKMADSPSLDIEQECATWDWVRAAGVSVEDLRKAVKESLADGQADGRIDKAA